MANRRIIRNAQTGEVVLGRAKWCASIWCRFRGLQFTFQLADDEGLLFVNGEESVVHSTITMFSTFISLGVVWLDSSGKVVDKQLAKPWRPAYAPAQAAQYYIEATPAILQRVKVGDILNFDEEAN